MYFTINSMDVLLASENQSLIDILTAIYSDLCSAVRVFFAVCNLWAGIAAIISPSA